jgi:HD-like signal output (HDOD) protein
VRGAELLERNQVETSELRELAKLPPFRPVVISLLRLFDRSDVDIQQVCSLVEADPSLASEILAVVNSPLFAVPQRVFQPSHAIVLLGAERTKSLAATLAMRSLLAGPADPHRAPLLDPQHRHGDHRAPPGPGISDRA